MNLSGRSSHLNGSALPENSLYVGAIFIIAPVCLLFDLYMPLGVAGGVPHITLVLISWWFPQRNSTFWLAALSSVLVFLGYLYSPSAGIVWIVITNRLLALSAIWIFAFFIHRIKKENLETIKSREQSDSLRRIIESINQQQTLQNKLVKTVGSNLLPDQLFQQIAKEIRQAIPCDLCMISRPTRGQSGYAYWAVESDTSFQIINDDDFFDWVIREVYRPKKIKIVPDLTELDTEWAKIRAEEGTRSVIIAPVVQDGESTLHITLGSNKTNAFDEGHEKFLASIADYLGAAAVEADLYEEALTHRQIFQSLFEDSSDAVMVTDEAGKISYWNRAAERFYGYTYQEAVGKSFIELIVLEKDRESWSSRYSEFYRSGVIEEGKSFSHESYRVRKGGRVLLVDISLSPVRDSRGRIIATSSIHRDRTVAKQKEADRIRQVKRLERLNALTRQIGSRLDLSEIFDFVIKSTCDLFDFPYCRIFLIEGEIVSPATPYHLSPGAPKEAPKDLNLRLGEGVTGRAAALGKTHYISDVTKHPLWDNQEWSRAGGFKSYLGVPLRSGDTNLGVLVCLSNRVRHFTDEEIQLIEAFAQGAAIAIQNAQTYAESQARAQRLDVQNRIARAISSTLNPSELFKIIASEIRSHIQCVRIGISYFHPEQGNHIWHYESDVKVDLPTPDDFLSLWYQALYLEGKPYYVSDFRQLKSFRAESLVKNGVLSSVAVPILQDDIPIAHITLSSDVTDAFSEEDVELLVSVSELVASAIQNARLFEESKKNHNFFQSVTRDNHAPIIIMDLDFKVLQWNHAAETLYGYTEAEALGKNLSELIFLDEDREEFEKRSEWQGLREMRESGKSVEFEAVRVRKNGTKIPVRITVSPIMDESGNITGISGIHQDLTLAKESEKAREQHIARLEAFNELIQKISESLDLKETLNFIVESTATLLNVEYARIFTLEKDLLENNIFVSIGYYSEKIIDVPEIIYAPMGKGIVGRIAVTGKTRYIEDVTKDPDWQHKDWLEGGELGAYLGVPLKDSDQVIGVLNCLSRKGRKFTEEEIRLIETFTAAAAIAIKNAQAYAESQARAQRLDVQNKIARAISSTLTPPELFQVIADEIRSRIPCVRFGISHIHPEKGIHLWHIESDIEIDLLTQDEFITPWYQAIYLERKPHYIGDLRRIKSSRAETLAKRGILSMVGVPILQDDTVIAHISLFSGAVNAFSREDIELLVSVSGLVASAIQNAKLYESAVKQVAALESLQEAALSITAELNYSDLLENISAKIQEFLGTDRFVLTLRSADDDLIYPAHSHGMSEGYLNLLKDNAPRLLANIAMISKEPLLIEDIREISNNPFPIEEVLRENFLSILFCPLLHRDEAIGALVFYWGDVREFSKEEVALAQSFAHYIAISIRNAGRFELEHRAKEEWMRTFDTITNPIAVMDNDHNIRRVNKAMADRLGCSPEDLIGQKCYEAFHHCSEPPIDCPHASVCESGQILQMEAEDTVLGGTFIRTGAPLFDKNGNVNGTVLWAVDISDMKEAEQELQKSHKEIQGLSSQFESFREEENINISREVHGELESEITGLKRAISHLEDQLSEKKD